MIDRGPTAAEDTAPTTRDRRLARVEAVLLVAREPLSSRRLAMLANLADGTEARTLVRRLNEMYEQSGTAFRAEDVAGGYRLMSLPKYSPWLRRVCGAPAEIRLSAPALETLAVVAYRQPVLRVDIEAVRGVQCGEILRQLLERDLVKIAGRSEELGRPFLYGTTRNFLQLFGLRTLDNLPRVELFRSPDEDAKTDAPETAHSEEDEPGDDQVSIQIESPTAPQEPDTTPEEGEATEIQAVVLDDHGEFEDGDDEDDEDDDGFDMYGDYDDAEDAEEVEDADWEEVDGEDDDEASDDDEDWGDYDDDDVDDDDDEEDY